MVQFLYRILSPGAKVPLFGFSAQFSILPDALKWEREDCIENEGEGIEGVNRENQLFLVYPFSLHYKQAPEN